MNPAGWPAAAWAKARWPLVISLILVAGTASSCLVRPAPEPAVLRRGMTESEVRARWGEPAHITWHGNEAIWTYRAPPSASGRGPYQTLWFIDGRLR